MIEINKEFPREIRELEYKYFYKTPAGKDEKGNQIDVHHTDNWSAFELELSALIIQAKEEVNRHIEQRLEQHRDNLRLWEDGTLVPTAQDEQEVEVTKEGLRAAIYELEKIKELLSPNKSDGGEANDDDFEGNILTEHDID